MAIIDSPARVGDGVPRQPSGPVSTAESTVSETSTSTTSAAEVSTAEVSAETSTPETSAPETSTSPTPQPAAVKVAPQLRHRPVRVLRRALRARWSPLVLLVIALLLLGGFSTVSAYRQWSAILNPPAATPRIAAAPAAPAVAPEPDLLVDAEITVPRTTRSTLVNGERIYYDASKLTDGDPSTAWRAAGDLSGKTIEITLPTPSVVNSVGLINGRTAADPKTGEDRYPQERRVTRVTWQFDNGIERVQFLKDDNRSMQSIQIGPIHTETVKLRIDSLTASGGFNYTAISEIQVRGQAD